MKTKDFALQVKELSNDGSFEGYASTFGGSPDSYGDIVAPGAFAETLVEHHRSGTMPMMYFGHDSRSLPIGDWLEMAEDGKGLLAKGQIDIEDEFGFRIHNAMKKKRVRGLSIGYSIPAGGSEPDEKRPGVTILKKIKLVEVSVVNNPANKRSLIETVKSDRMEEFARRLRDGDPMPIKEFEGILREVGVPNSLATQIASVGYAKAVLGEPEGEKADPRADLIRALMRD